ncbi:unconventional prefoldin RPB5 interactor [Hetaerina americana]|uniref:unconventional prefoldin RPB5 interactor n=1 Tax=Hetaerina americana TaxID=62018 RepID=UPI003A7F4EF2
MEKLNKSDIVGINTASPVSGYDIFNQQYERSLDENKAKQDYCEKHKAELSSVRSHLETLPNELSYDVMIPIGSQGLMRGKMVHTNEILTLIGDNWYVKTSAKQATEICQRRLERCDTLLIDIEKERELIKTWRGTTQELFQSPGENAREIYEEYDEKKEKEWREIHRENVRKHFVDLAKLRNQENKTESDHEEALQRRLDDLEKLEEMEDELIRSGEDIDGCSTDSEDENGNEEGSKDINNALSPSGDSQAKRRVSFSEVVHAVDLEAEEKEKPEPLRIYFRHSDAVVKSSEENLNESVSQPPCELASPSDVYTHYASLFSPSSTPKSILKQRSRSPSEEENSEGIPGYFIQERLQSPQLETGTDPDVKTEANENDQLQPQAVAFGDVIVEHNPVAEYPVPDNIAQVTRPVSRFKASRQKQKNK